MTNRSGYSYLGMVPSANIVEGTLNMVLAMENDINMRGGVHQGVQRGRGGGRGSSGGVKEERKGEVMNNYEDSG